MVGSQYKPGEVAKMEWATVQHGPSWAVDSWGLGCMMQVRCSLLQLSAQQGAMHAPMVA
jgi:hypothetical protein